MAVTIFRFARTVDPDGVNPVRSTTLTAKVPGTSTTVTLYTDPTLTTTLSSAGQFTTDSTGFAEFATGGVGSVDIYNGSTLIQSNVPVGVFYPVDAPLNSGGSIPANYTAAGALALAGGVTQYANMPRVQAGINGTALTTQVMTSVAIYLPAGALITNISFRSATTALGATSTNWWFALYSSAATPALLAQTADQTTAAWAANTWKTLALSAAQTIPSSGIYWASVMVNDATAVPTLASATSLASTGALGTDVILAQTSGSSLGASAPPTITGGAGTTNVPIVVLS